MGSNWETLQLKNAGVKLIDCVHKTPPDAGRGVPYIAIPQIKEGHINFSANPRLINNENFLEWTKKAKPQHNDIILSRRCNPGETAYVPPEVKFALGQNLVLLRSDGSKIQPSFLRWLVRGQAWWEQVRKFINVGAVFDSLKCGEIPKFELPIPPLPDQEAIAHVLGSLDDRIELNRRMNGTLEAMAQALFKSWFVDFDPVIDNALAGGKEIPEELSGKAQARAALGDKRRPLPEEIRTLFPDEFIFSDELGWIPKGWEEKQVGDLLDLVYGKSLPAKNREPGSYPVYGSGGVGGQHNKAIVVGPGIIVGRKGTVGSVYWESGDFFPIDTVFFVKQKIDVPLYWIYQNLLHMDIASLGADSAVPGVNRNAICFKKWVLPSTSILENYWDQLSVFVDRRQTLVEQDKSLGSLRDTLLPKLLSGELRIPDAEKMVEELAL